MIFTLLFASTVSILAGCSTEGDERRRQAFLDNKYREISNTCDRYGFRRGTVEFSNCMQQAEAQWNNNYNASIQQRNQAMQTMVDALKPPAFIPPPCNGGMMSTTGNQNCK